MIVRRHFVKGVEPIFLSYGCGMTFPSWIESMVAPGTTSSSMLLDNLLVNAMSDLACMLTLHLVKAFSIVAMDGGVPK